jgi:hypothetical protein
MGFMMALTENITRGREIMFLGSRAQPLRMADNHTAMCKPIVKTVWNLNISKLYGSPCPVMGLALAFK